MAFSKIKYLMDTHVWVWWNISPDKLSPKAMSLIENNNKYDEILLSVISIWEFCKLLEKERIIISCDTEEWLKEALIMPKLRIVELTSIISLRSTTLPAPFHEDPADQIIAASAREENVIIITKDKLISDYMHVKTIW